MRGFVLALAVAVVCGVSERASAQVPDGSAVLAATREALGGEKRLSGIKSFIVTGRTRQLRGNNLVPIEFEIQCELPDKFLRTDETPAQDSDPTTYGFNGSQLIQVPQAPLGRGPAPGGGRGGGQRVTALKQDFARLMLGMFAASYAAYPLTFKYAATGEAPEGKADILEVAGPESFRAQLVIQRATHLPVMIMWHMPVTTVVVKIPGFPLPSPLPAGAVVVEGPPPPESTASQLDRDNYAALVAELRRQALSKAKPVEHRLYYGDFRQEGGFKLPFRLRRAIGGETVEETTFDRIRVNPQIDVRKFGAVQ